MSLKRVVANITSDVICPWCWVGKRSLELAVKDLNSGGAPRVHVALQWHPYFLHRNIPDEGVDKLKHYTTTFGKARAKKLLTDPDQHVKVRGRGVGVEFNWRKGTLLSNSMKGHKLLLHVLEQHGHEKQNELMEAIFRRYFAENLDVGNPAVLQAAVEEVGLPVEGLEEVYASQRLGDLVTETDKSNEGRVKTIPHFELSDAEAGPGAPFIRTGAEEVADFKEIITKNFL